MGRSQIVAGGVFLLLTACGTQKQVGEKLELPANSEVKAENTYLRIGTYDNPTTCGFRKDAVPARSNDYYLVLSATFRSPDSGHVVYDNDPGTTAPAAPPLSYDAAGRGLLARFLEGRNVSFTLQATVKVDDATIPIPLYAMSHNSNAQDGENFVSDLSLVSHDHFIRVGDTSPVSAEFDASFSDTRQSNMLGIGVQIAKSAVMAISPNAHVLTTLNKKSLQQQAAVWDKTLGTAMSQAVSEKVPIDVTAKELREGGCAIASLSIPGPAGGADPTVPVGFWIFSAQKRRASLFIEDSELPAVSDPAQTLSAQRILNTHIGISDDQTIEKYLKTTPVNDALTSWSTATKDTDTAMGKSDKSSQSQAADKENSAADAVCRGAVDTLYAVGLTSTDSKLSLWAVLTGMSLPGNPPAAHVRTLQGTCAPYIAPFAIPQPKT